VPDVPSNGQLEPAPEVLDGELLTDEQEQEYERRKGLRQLPARVVLLVVQVRESEHTAKVKAAAKYRASKAPRDAVRLACFALRGHARWIAKGWTWATYGDLRADARAARLAGDSEARRKAQEAIRADARARWAKVGVVMTRVAIGAALVTVLAVVLVIVDSKVAREDMWGWLVTVYAVLDVMGAVLPWLLASALPAAGGVAGRRGVGGPRPHPWR
jgi:S-DNA-T family DNA segregation ATPase FtsK/SpoIIIE